MHGEEASISAGIIVGELVLLAVLIALNGFFVAVEFATVASRRTRIDQLASSGSRGARVVQRWLSDPRARDRLIAGAQLGITAASLALGIVGESAFDLILAKLFAGVETSPALNTLIAGLPFFLSIVIVSALHVVLGEQVPKVGALRGPERVAAAFALPMQLFNTIFRPLVSLLDWASAGVLRLLGMEPADGHAMVHSIEELRQIVHESEEMGVLDEDEREIIEAVFDIRNLLTRQVMVPRTEIDMLPADMSQEEIEHHVIQRPFNKYPVYDRDPDDIIGVLYVKDLIGPQQDDATAGALCTEALFVPENLPVVKLMQLFRESGKHIAIVHDEFGGTEGLVTLDDVLGEIVGDLPDRYEYEDAAADVVTHREDDWLINGLMTIEDFNETFGEHLHDENYNTIGGYVMGRLERVPRVGDTVSGGTMVLRVESMDALRIDRLSVKRLTPTAHNSAAGEENTGHTPDA